MKLIKDKHIIIATEKSYRVLYRGRGYVPYNDSPIESNPIINDELVYDELTKSQIAVKLDKLKIDYDIKDKKQVLFDLLRGV